MDFDPHTLHLILERIEQQMRCPQCGKKVPVDFSAVRVVSDKAMLLQLKCDTCNAYIVLHASVQGTEHLSTVPYEVDQKANVSSTLQMSEKEMQEIRHALEDGSFQKFFTKGEDEPKKSPKKKNGDLPSV